MGELDAYEMAKHGVFHQTIIYPASIFKKYKYKEKYKIHADYALNMELWKDKKYKFIYRNYIIADFNHTGASGTITDVLFKENKSRLILKNFGLVIWLRYKIRNLKNRQ